MLVLGRISLVVFLVPLLVLGCSSTREESTGNDPKQPIFPAKVVGGLQGSTWIGEGASQEEPYSHNYVFTFSSNRLKIEVKCHSDSNDASLTVESPVTYTENGNVATLKTGIFSRAPMGDRECSASFPANLEFHLEGSSIYLVLEGKRQDTQLKRME